MNDEETRAQRAMGGNPRICVSDGIVYMAPFGYTPIGMNGLGEMLAVRCSEDEESADIMVLPRVGRTTSGD